MDGGRRRVLVAAGAALLLAAVALLVVAAVDPGRQAASAGPSGDGETSSIRGASLLLRAVDPRDPTLNGRVLVIDHGGKRAPSGTGLACQRIHFAGGRGLCLGVAPSGVDFEATIFDAGLRPLRRLALTGIPSRARVSPDGRLGAMTVFVAGHEYLGGSGFSTTTTIVDMRTGKQVAELEEFDVVRDGTRFKRPDFNFWGVTFARDPSRFYATLRTGGHHYLVEGDLDARRMEVIRDGVECPSLSPGGDRIAYKSRVDGTDRWRLRVLDLTTGSDHPVAERRSIDDQAEWLDGRTIAYAYGGDVYSVPADGAGSPRRIAVDAVSPTRLRWGAATSAAGDK